jgi:hypothetical protein
MMNVSSDNTDMCRSDEAVTATVDTLSQRGAMALARRLEQFWHEQGYPAVRFWAEPIDERFAKVGTYEVYRVTCNLVGGLPPRYRDDSTRSP